MFYFSPHGPHLRGCGPRKKVLVVPPVSGPAYYKSVEHEKVDEVGKSEVKKSNGYPVLMLGLPNHLNDHIRLGGFWNVDRSGSEGRSHSFLPLQ